MKRVSALFIVALFCVTALLDFFDSSTNLQQGMVARAEVSSFRFAAWSDMHVGPDLATNNLRVSEIADQIAALDPNFTIVPGDLEDSGFTADGIEVWKEAVNGQFTGDTAPSGLFDITLPSRGNYDKLVEPGDWETYFNTGQMSDQIGATNYSHQGGEEEETYSFDYGNSHFVSLDVPGRFDVAATHADIDWLDSDLDAAEGRGLTHAFLFFHGPVYCIQAGDPTMCPYCDPGARVSPLPALNDQMIEVINKHPIVSAAFSGHEGTNPYTHLDSTRIPDLTHPFEQFLVGNTTYPNTFSANYEARYDYLPPGRGFLMLDVEGASFTANWYQTGKSSPIKSLTFSKAEPTTPVVSIEGAPESVVEGTKVDLTAYVENGGEAGGLDYSWEVTKDGVPFASGSKSRLSFMPDDNGAYVVILTVTNRWGRTGQDSKTITVSNAPPEVEDISGPKRPVPIGSVVKLNATFNDPGTLDTHTAVWRWGTGRSPGVVTESSGSGSVSGKRIYNSPGIYQPKLVLTDSDGASVTSPFCYVVVYSASKSYETGSGWIDSPAGAYTPDPSLSGKASFGFVSSHSQGASISSRTMQIRFSIGGLKFANTGGQCVWASGLKARYRGVGVINGTGSYSFVLSINDGQVAGRGGVDKLRLKIWDTVSGKVVYDNQMGAPNAADARQAIAGGDIMVRQ
ncbi:MAG: PKD domain-containing protein [Chloroflexi bacterium]|nr:PKD domain-containing protein [Chloroflexota bacterium]